MIGQDAKTAIQALAEKRREPDDLPPAAKAAPILEQTGIGRASSGIGGSPGNGIAWPLTETSYAARTWHTAALSAQSTDGIWMFVWDLPHEITLTDGNGSSGDLVLAAPA